MRTFISINLPEEVKQELKNIQGKLPEFQGKLTENENLHLTLKFLGDVSEKEVITIRKKLKEIKLGEFEAETGELGVFSENFIRIVWMHLLNCEGLQQEVDNNLSDMFAKENRFMSHVTLARVKNVEDREKFTSELREIKTKKIKFKVDKFFLMKSDLTTNGPEYTVLEEFALKN